MVHTFLTAFMLCLWLGATPGWAAQHPAACPAFITGRALFKAEPSPEPDRYYDWEGHTLYTLGRGTSGTVFKAVSQSGKTVKVVKAFHELPSLERQWDDFPTVRDRDIKVLKSFVRDGCPEATGFRIPRPVPVTLNIALGMRQGRAAEGIQFYDSVVGRTVASVLNDFSISADVREYVAKRYREQMKLLDIFLKEKYDAKPDTPGAAQMVRGNPNNPAMQLPFFYGPATIKDGEGGWYSGHLVIKADGVIVHPRTLDLYLVDAQ